MITLPMAEMIDQISRLNLLNLIHTHTKSSLERLIENIYSDRYKGKDAAEVLKTVRRIDFLRTKRRWAETARKDYQAFVANSASKKKWKELAGEYQHLTHYYKEYGAERFTSQMASFSTPEGLIEARQAELQEWANDDARLITDYPYIQHKTNLQIEKAILLDIAMLIGAALTKQTQHDLEIIESPYSATDNPLFANSQSKIKVDGETLKQNSKEYYKKSYQAGKTQLAEVLIDKDYAAQKDYKVPDLDMIDSRIFLEVMSHRGKLFATQKLITVRITDLVKGIYSSDGKKNYENLESRLKKMQHFSLVRQYEDGGWESIGIFSDVKVLVQEDGTRVAEIYVSEAVYKDYIQNQTVRIYKDKIFNLSSGYAHHLIFPLQKERLARYQMNLSFETSMDYLYFATKVRFTKRRKADNLRDIEIALQELIDQQIVVKAFERIRDVFYIQFHPVQEKEVQNLLAGGVGTYEKLPFSTAPFPEA
ncbi:hypothetical protein [Ectobacillus ponti]|uniref:Uncharacterized protein n=1 Tax=Ectobacillus ponti TaxID=2961894 RepID=A0AA42BQR0_9BACI|nr:hypothetical protein [Ectobacillus ponti]MCP8970152.1 hypothetical protein [Ectobacillus ponti]